MSLAENIRKNTETIIKNKKELATVIQEKGGTIDTTVEVPTFEQLKNGVNTIQVGGSGDVKLFATVEEMNASTDNKEGDLAIVYSNVLENFTVTTEAQVIMFPKTVVLPSAYTDSAYTMFRGVGNSYFDGQVELGSTYFRFDGWGDTGSIRVTYESTDGITYTRTDTLDTTLDLGAVIRCYYVEEWNDNFGYFMLSSVSNFMGLYMYTLGEYVTAPNQLSLSTVRQLLPNISAYGKDGVITGDGSIYADCIQPIAENNYSNHNPSVYANHLVTDITKVYDVIKKYNYDVNGTEVLSVIKRRDYDTTYDMAYTVPYEGTRFITNGIFRDYTFDDNYFYACSAKNVDTIVKYSRKDNTATVIPCTGDTAKPAMTYDCPITRFLYNGNIYKVVWTANTATSSDNSVTVVIQKLDLTAGTITNIYTKKIAVGTYYSSPQDMRRVQTTYTNGKVIINVLRGYATSSTSSAYYKAYTIVYDLATGTETTLQNGTSICTDSTFSPGYGYKANFIINTDEKYLYITYSLINFYQYKYDLTTGSLVYGKQITGVENMDTRKYFDFVYFNDEYALMPSGCYNSTDKTYHSEITKMNLSDGTVEIALEIPSFSSGYRHEWATSLDGKQIVIDSGYICDITDNGLVYRRVQDVIAKTNYSFMELIEKPNCLIYKQLSICQYVIHLTDVTETIADGEYCDIYGVFGSAGIFVTPQMLIDKWTEKILLDTSYSGTISPAEYEEINDIAEEVLGGAV